MVRDRHADAHLGPVIVTKVGVLIEGLRRRKSVR
jgi:hypothetical protein